MRRKPDTSDRIVIPTEQQQVRPRPAAAYYPPPPPPPSTGKTIVLPIIGHARGVRFWRGCLAAARRRGVQFNVNMNPPNQNMNMNANLGFDSNFNFNTNISFPNITQYKFQRECPHADTDAHTAPSPTVTPLVHLRLRPDIDAPPTPRATPTATRAHGPRNTNGKLETVISTARRGSITPPWRSTS